MPLSARLSINFKKNNRISKHKLSRRKILQQNLQVSGFVHIPEQVVQDSDNKCRQQRI